MATTFSFDASSLTTAGYLDRADFTTGRYPYLDYPSQYSAVAPNQSIATSGGVDVVALTLVAGQRYTFDIDRAAIDLELDIINQRGIRVAGDDDSGVGDSPFLSFTASQTGTYYVAVHHASNDYLDGTFRFEGTPAPIGRYQFSVSTPDLPPQGFPFRQTLTNSGEARSFTDNAQVVRALGGNDTLFLNGGDDIAIGGTGADSLYGGAGRDELVGGTGGDRLEGGLDEDVLRGGTESDRLYGGAGRDGLTGGTGNDLLAGESGNDTLWGESGNDALYGGSGDDFLRGGTGLDTLYGGMGEDTFHFLPGEAPASGFSQEDRIEDFGIGDLIDLSGLFGTLSWGGRGSGFTAVNQVRVVDIEGRYVDVRVNLDTDQASEFEVLVDVESGVLDRNDFIL